MRLNAPHQRSIRLRRGDAKRSKCCSHISNASLGWDDYDYEAHAASKMNLLSQQPPRTSGNWLNSSRWCQPQDDTVVPPQNAQQNIRRNQHKRTKPSDFFNTIGSLQSFAALCLNVLCGWLLHCKSFLAIFAVVSSVLSSVRPVYVLALPPLALMNSASEVPIGLSTSDGRCHSRSVLALG